MENPLFLLIILVAAGCAHLQQSKISENFDFGKTEEGHYENEFFNLDVSFDQEWVIQDEQQVNNIIEMGSDIIVGEDEHLKSLVKSSQVNTAYLLTIFKHEFGAAIEFNP